MRTALVIGATGFVGRHAVEELSDHGYDVTSFARGKRGYRFADDSAVETITGDRSDPDAVADLAERVDPDVVVDCAAFHPTDVQTATEVFADVDAYVYVSSGAVYGVQEIPKREDETPLHDCTPEQAADDSMESYGPRKAECDREVVAAADRGVAATSVRPTLVYGPLTTGMGASSPTEETPTWADVPGILTHHDYWVDRVANHDRVVVPGDGTAIWHRVYVEDLAAALRVVAETGTPGEAYNVADRRVCTIEDVVELIADALGTSVEVVHANRRELETVGLDPNDFVLYHHQMTEYPHVLDTCKLASLGWESTPVEEAMERTAAESIASDRTGRAHDPGRDAEEQLLESLTG